MIRKVRSQVVVGVAMLLTFVGCVAVDGQGRTEESVLQTRSGRSVLPEDSSTTDAGSAPKPVVHVGAESLAEQGFASLNGKTVGLIVNQASTVGDQHLVDVAALSPDIEVGAIFAPEHGVRGTTDAGQSVPDEVDGATGLPVFSLYGSVRKPTPQMLEGLDVLVYDLQDVGVRYYTYISTMGLAMQAAAEAGVEFVVLDRPNPLGGSMIAGFTPLKPDSFVSQYPIPTVHGMTSGELALAIKGERWLPGLENLELEVQPMQGWGRSTRWNDTNRPWVPPSPGLPTAETSIVYPATVLFEATTVSYGKGTDQPFRQIGAPWIDGVQLAETLTAIGIPGVEFSAVEFTPKASETIVSPRLEGEKCAGVSVTVQNYATFDPSLVGLHLLAAVEAQAQESLGQTMIDRPQFVDLLAGSSELRTTIVGSDDSSAAGNATTVAALWQQSVQQFADRREPYLLYS